MMHDHDQPAGVGPAATQIERVGERAFVVRRRFAAPPARVYRAWSDAEVFRRWWVPDGFGVTLLACEMDVRTGGGYRLVFAAGDDEMAFFGRYTEVVPGERMVWTNEEAPEGGVTTVTFAPDGDGTLVTYGETYPDAAGLEEALAGSAQGLPAQLDQLAALLASAP